MFERLLLAQVAELAMGETIIAEDCDGRGLPIYSAATGDTAWNYSTRIKRRLPKGTIVVGARGSIGFPRMPGDEWFGATQTTITVAAKESDVLPKYLFHFLRGLDFKTLTSQQAIPMLTVADFGALSLPLPPASEQAKIAEVLDTLDTTIRQTEALIDKLKLVKQGLLHDLLTRGIDANGELRPPQSEAPGLYRESVAGRIPKEWADPLLGACTFWFSGGTPSRAVASHWIGDVALLTPKDMKAFELADTSEHISAKAAVVGSRLMPPETVFIVVRGMILAHTFPVALSLRSMAFNQDIKAISAGPGVLPRFLAHWFVANQAMFLRKVTEATHGTKKLDADQLMSVPLGLPPLREQRAIVERYAVLDERLSRESAYTTQLVALRHGLMTDLLTGRVRVTPLLEPTA